MGRFTDLGTSFSLGARIPLFGKLVSHIRTLSPGDRFIALTLGAALILAILTGLYALERQFLVEVPSYGGSVTEGVVGHPRFVNPLLALSDADRDLTALTYAGLMGYDRDGALAPVLAESYSVSEDGKTYTFRLRANARFSDGTPLTAEDVVFTVGRAQDPGLLSPRLADWANIRAEAVDSRTVRFTLPKAYAPFLEDATLGILPAHVWRDISNEEFAFSPYMSNPVGSGPFKVTSVTRSREGVIERYDLSAASTFALGRPYLSAFHFVFFETQAEVAEAYSRGRIESAYGVTSPSALRVPYSRIFGVFWNASANPAFARPEVRKALSVALDRQSLVEDVLRGYATPANGPVPPGLIPAEVVESPENPTSVAADILEAGGWTYDGETRMWVEKKANLTLSITLSTSNVPELRALAERVKSDWERLGVSVSMEFHEPNDLVASVIRPRKYEALLFGMVVGRDRDLFAFWDSSQRNDPGLNIALYANREADELLDAIRAESDPAQVKVDLEKLNTVIAADYPAAFTHSPDFLYVFPEDLHGVALSSVAEPSDRLLTAAYWYEHTEALWPAFAPVR